MVKLKCPKCGCHMIPDIKYNKSWCANCGYNKPTEEEIRLANWPL